MGLWGKSEKEIDEEHEWTMERLFKELEAEQDPQRKENLRARIRQLQEDYKDRKKKKAKWRIFG